MSGKKVGRKGRKAIIVLCIAAVLIAGIAIGILFLRRSCSSTYEHEIKSVDDLYKIENLKSYTLRCDIDLDGEIWEPKRVKNFDGGGHTIKNVTITSMEDNTMYSGFFATVNKLSNVNFENVRVIIPDASDGSNTVGIACGRSASVENVHIKGCVLRVNTKGEYTYQIGGISGEGESFVNCSVENSNLRLIGQHNHTKYWTHMGGIVGYCQTNVGIKDCKVTATEMYCKTLTHTNTGLIAGEIKAKAEMSGLIATDSKIEADGSANRYLTRVGGLIGNIDSSDGVLLNSASCGNSITCTAIDRFCIGGLAGRSLGTVKNCLSDGNTVVGVTGDDSNTENAHAAGLCGANSGTVNRSVAQNCSVTGPAPSSGKTGYTAGFVSYNSGSLSYCGVWQNTLEGGRKAAFAGESENIFYCLEQPDAEQWANVMTALQLDGGLWRYDDGLILKIKEPKI